MLRCSSSTMRPTSFPPRASPGTRKPHVRGPCDYSDTHLAFMKQEAKRLPGVHDPQRGLAEPGEEKGVPALPRAVPAEGRCLTVGWEHLVLRWGAQELEHRYQLKKTRAAAGGAPLGDGVRPGNGPAVPGRRRHEVEEIHRATAGIAQALHQTHAQDTAERGPERRHRPPARHRLGRGVPRDTPA